jgi:aspartyl aminopeptidase
VDRSVNETLKFNQETEFMPILGLIESQLNSPAGDDQAKVASSIQENHHPALLALLSSELSISPQEIHDFEL